MNILQLEARAEMATEVRHLRLGGTGRRLWRAAVAGLAALTVAACASGPSDRNVRQGGPSGSIEGVYGGGAPRSLQPTGPLTPGLSVPVDPRGPVRVALLAPMSAPDQDVRTAAESLVDAARLALRDVGDQSLQLKIFDTRADPAAAAAAARDAAASGAAVILGPLFSASTMAVGPVARDAGLTVMSFSNDPSAAGDNVYLLGFMADQEIQRVLRFAGARGIQEVAALGPNNQFGQVAIAAARQAGPSAGVSIIDTQFYTRDFEGIESAVTEYTERAKLTSETGPQGVLLVDNGQALQTLAAYLAFFDISPRTTKFLGVSGWSSELTRKETALREGWFAAPDPRVKEQFDARFLEATGRQAHPLASIGYDSAAAVAALVAEARSVGTPYPFAPQAIVDPSGFAGVNGVFRFLPNGLNERGLAVLEVRADRFAVIDPAPTSFSGF